MQGSTVDLTETEVDQDIAQSQESPCTRRKMIQIILSLHMDLSHPEAVIQSETDLHRFIIADEKLLKQQL